MLRRPLADAGVGSENGFRWRGAKDIVRIEGLSDGVFGFAITLLIVSLEVPRSFGDLVATMRGFLGFAVTFYALFRIWYSQYLFFRRFGLNDAVTITLNAALLFVILFYTYPLKFLAGALLGGAHEGEPLALTIADHDWWLLMVIFGAGYVAVHAIFALLDGHALHLRRELELTERETFETEHSIRDALTRLAVALLSMAVAVALRGRGGEAGLYSGLVYVLTVPALAVLGVVDGRRRARFDPSGDP